MNVEKNRVVSLNYTLKNSEGAILDTSEGRSPLVYLHGVGALIPGLELKLEGEGIGAKISAVIPPEEAYGEPSEEMFYKVPASGFAGDEEMAVGMQVQLDTENGPALAVICNIDGEEVTLDLNHPLAGVELYFDVEIMDVREATQDEINHGHVHGDGGHHH